MKDRLGVSEELKVNESISTETKRSCNRDSRNSRNSRNNRSSRDSRSDWQTDPSEIHKFIDECIDRNYSGGIEIHFFKGVPNKKVKLTRSKFLGGYE